MKEQITPTEPLKIYVASTLANWKRVRSICNILKAHGIQITYDWSQYGEKIFGEGTEVDRAGIPKTDKLAEIALDEVRGVMDCDAILVIMPGERGSHFELALAWYTGTPIVILTDGETAPRPTSFHYLPRIERISNEQRAIDRTIDLARTSKERGLKAILVDKFRSLLGDVWLPS